MESVIWAFKQPVRQGPRLRGLPRAPLLLGVRDAAFQLRDPPGRQLPGPDRSGGDRPLRPPAGEAGRPAPDLLPGRSGAGVDDDALDAARPTWRSLSVPTSTTPCWSDRRRDGRPSVWSSAPIGWRLTRPSSRGDRGRPGEGLCPRRAAIPPAFDYFAATENAFVVLGGDFVTTEDGTGVVHMAPGFGEDDQRACETAGIAVVAPVDDAGRFTSEVSDFAGVQVFEANAGIVARLRENGVLLRRRTTRTATPTAGGRTRPSSIAP